MCLAHNKNEARPAPRCCAATTTPLRRLQVDSAPANGPSDTARSLGFSLDFLTRESK